VYMSDQVKLEEENSSYKESSNQSQDSGMIGFLISKGIVKTKKSAGIVLFVITILFITLTVYLYIFVLGGKNQNEIILTGAEPGQKLIPIEYPNEQ